MSLVSATTLAFPLPVPRGLKVVSQDADKVWHFEKDGSKDNDPLPCFRHRPLEFSSTQSSSSLPSTAFELAPSPSSNSFAASDAIATASSTGAGAGIGTDNTLFAMEGGIVIEELDVEIDIVDGFCIFAFDFEF